MRRTVRGGNISIPDSYWRPQQLHQAVSARSPRFWVMAALLLLSLAGGTYLWVLNGLLADPQAGVSANTATRLTVDVASHSGGALSILIVYLVSFLPAAFALLFVRRGRIANVRSVWTDFLGVVIVVLILHAMLNGVISTWSVQGQVNTINTWGSQHLQLTDMAQYPARVDGKTATYVLVNGNGKQVAFTIDSTLKAGDTYYTYRIIKVPSVISGEKQPDS